MLSFEYLKLLLDTNSIEVLPEEVQQKYVVSDCYVYVPLTQKLIDKWTNTIITTIADITLREADYKETGSEMCFWDTDESVEKNSFYFATLSGYSGNLHKPYGKYLERLETRRNGGDLFDGVGSSFDENITTTDKIIRNKPNESGEVDLSWLDAL